MRYFCISLNHFRLCGLLLLLTLCNATFAQNSLSGKITDANTGEAIVGAMVYFPEIKMGVSSDINGTYRMANLPKGKLLVEAKFISYGSFIKQINVNGPTALDIQLSQSTALKEVVITALGNVTNTLRSAVPVTIVNHETFTQQSSTNVVDAIATQPGVTAITTGPGISKPEINGLGFNRVLTLFDGERQEDFQWGDEHGILIDPFAVYDAEIIRGPASLQYGNYAVAGVVSFKSQPLPEDGSVRGSYSNEYQTNNGLIGNSLNLGGNKNGIVWDVRASQEASHCYWDPKDGYVWGSAFNQENVRATIGINRNWGVSRLSYSYLHREIEIPDGNRDSASGKFAFDVPLNPSFGSNGQLLSGQVYPTRANFLSYNARLAAPYQLLDHQTLWWQNNLALKKGSLLFDIGFSQSGRQEVDTGKVTVEGMVVHDVPYSLKYQYSTDSSGFKITTGVNGTYEYNTDYAEPQAPYVGIFEIPNYHNFDVGGYGIAQKDYKNLTVSGGLRYDYRTMEGEPMYLINQNTAYQQEVAANAPNAVTQFSPFNRQYGGWSASLGATYQLPLNQYVKLNFAKSYRAPSILELTSNETDPANEYKQGNPNLKAEEGYQADLAYGYNGKDVCFEADGFYNYINNFIFADRIANKAGGDSLHFGVPVYKFGSSNTAIVAGVSAFFNIHPTQLAWLEMDNGFSYTYTYLPNATDSTNHLPFTPAPRLTSEVKLKLPNHKNARLKNTYVKFGVAQYWAQHNIYSALDNELPSAAYMLMNAGIGTDWVNRTTNKVICSVVINVTNLGNIAYIDHTSREQYMWSYNGAYAGPNNYGVTPAVVTKAAEGIYNMGRNIGFKLVFPFRG